jgi:hypothetical protein
LLVAALALGGYELAKHPPIGNIDRGEVGIRLNRFTRERRKAAKARCS